jgi:hypothetical protein
MNHDKKHDPVRSTGSLLEPAVDNFGQIAATSPDLRYACLVNLSADGPRHGKPLGTDEKPSWPQPFSKPRPQHYPIAAIPLAGRNQKDK